MKAARETIVGTTGRSGYNEEADLEVGLTMVEPARYGSLESYVKEQESMMHPGEDTRCFCCSWNVPVVLQPVCRYTGKCDRACTHCMFLLQFLGWCCLLSLPRMACIIDLIVTLAIYLGPMRHGMEVFEFLAMEAWPYDFEKSSLLVVTLAIVRSVTLFSVFAERRREWTIAVSTSMLLLTFGFIGAKIAVGIETNYMFRQPLLPFSIAIATIEYVLYWLVGRRRVVMHPRFSQSTKSTNVSAELPVSFSAQNLQQLGKLHDLKDDDSKFINISNRSIHYKLEKGDQKKSGEDIVLIHDFGSSLLTWNDAMPYIKPKARRILRFDLPGFGLSCRPTEWGEGEENPYTDAFWLKVVFGLMERVRIKKAALVGHGMGGSLAIIAASVQPRKVSRLVLVAPKIYGNSYVPKSLKPFLTTPSLLRAYYSKIQEESTYERKIVVKPQGDDKQSLMCDAEGWDTVIFELNKPHRSRYSVKAILPNLSTAVCIMHGKEDKMIPYKDSEIAFKNMNMKRAQHRLITLDRCGHVPHQELPMVFAEQATTISR
mmetsp:Transcript_37192/g.59742  ORF Transcript_37192/g.59742 Transcript_37192/m.59742 type:complete len:543 (-) Transcript_37192:61-1689(-)